MKINDNFLYDEITIVKIRLSNEEIKKLRKLDQITCSFLREIALLLIMKLILIFIGRSKFEYQIKDLDSYLVIKPVGIFKPIGDNMEDLI